MDSYDDGQCMHGKPRDSGCVLYPCRGDPVPGTERLPLWQQVEASVRYHTIIGTPQPASVQPRTMDGLTPEQVRSLLREAVTVVKPGELLVLRVSEEFTPSQLREYQEMLTGWCEYHAPGIQILVVLGEGGQIVRQESMAEATSG